MTPSALAPFLAHGGRVAAARAAFGGEDWIDLSTGIAPWRWPSEGIDLGLDRLPDPGGIGDLEAAAAAAFGSDAAGTVAVPGTDLALRLLGRLLPAARPAVVGPGYAGHVAAWPEARTIATLAEAGKHDLIVLASPANPDGRVTPSAALLAAGAQATVVLDEAYADPAPISVVGEGIVVLRSFGKFYGLPGLRLGFVIAADMTATSLRATLGDWPVSSAAIAIGTAAYRDIGWRDAQCRRIAAAGMALDAALNAAGLRIEGTAPLFRLVDQVDGERLFRHLAGHAILSRPFSDRGDRLRLGLPGDGAASARLRAALAEYRP